MTTARAKAKTTAAKEATDAMMAAGQDTAENFWKAGTENFQKMFTQNQQQAEQIFGKYDDFAKSGRENAEAVMSAGKIYAQGMEALMAQWMAFNKDLAEKSLTSAKKISQVNTVQEAIDTQTAVAKEWVDDFVSHGTRVGEMTAQVYQDTWAPLNQRVQQTVEQWTKTA